MENKTTGLALLREPFPPHQIGKLPKPTKGKVEMDKLPKAHCDVCGGYHAKTNIIHLDYVGHAALTYRLLECDPEWTYEILGREQFGRPALDENGGLWIALTVCGVTRYGYGDGGGKSGGNAIKEAIGDALRNAAMRFGAALGLWHKGELEADEPTPLDEQVSQQTKAANEPQKTFRDHTKDIEDLVAISSLESLATAWNAINSNIKQGQYSDEGKQALIQTKEDCKKALVALDKVDAA